MSTIQQFQSRTAIISLTYHRPLAIFIVALSMPEIIASFAPPSSAESPSCSITAPSAFSKLSRPLAVFEQASDACHLPPNADIDDLPHVELDDKRYLREEHTHRRRKRNSWIKEHGVYLILLPNKKKTFWLCRLCDARRKTVPSNLSSNHST